MDHGLILMAHGDVSVAGVRGRLTRADLRPMRFDDQAAFDCIDVFDNSRTTTPKKDRAYRILAFEWTIETAVDSDPRPYAVRIDVAGETKHRRDARAGRSQGRVDETAVCETFHVRHRV